MGNANTVIVLNRNENWNELSKNWGNNSFCRACFQWQVKILQTFSCFGNRIVILLVWLLVMVVGTSVHKKLETSRIVILVLVHNLHKFKTSVCISVCIGCDVCAQSVSVCVSKQVYIINIIIIVFCTIVVYIIYFCARMVYCSL